MVHRSANWNSLQFNTGNNELRMASRVRRGCFAAMFLLRCLGCATHPSDETPSKCGDRTVFRDPMDLDVGVSSKRMRSILERVIKEMELEIRWSHATNIGGNYIVRSAHHHTMKITFQAIAPNGSMVRIYQNIGGQTLATALIDAIMAASIPVPMREEPPSHDHSSGTPDGDENRLLRR